MSRHPHPWTPQCKEEGCKRVATRRGLCYIHVKLIPRVKEGKSQDPDQSS